MKKELGYLNLATIIEGKTIRPEGKAFINIALRELSANEREAIILNFDLRSTKPTYKEIGQRLGVTGEAVKQLIKRGLRKLRRKQRGESLKSCLLQLEEINTPETNPLLIPLEELDFSVRCIICFRIAGIKYVWQLIQKKDYELLRIRNLGRKSLAEITNLLSKFGLRLGIELPPEFLDQLKQKKFSMS